MIPTGSNIFAIYRKAQPEPLWWTVGKEDRNVVQMITYGLVPDMFRQHIPVSGEPPELQPGRDYCA